MIIYDSVELLCRHCCCCCFWWCGDVFVLFRGILLWSPKYMMTRRRTVPAQVSKEIV